MIQLSNKSQFTTKFLIKLLENRFNFMKEKVMIEFDGVVVAWKYVELYKEVLK